MRKDDDMLGWLLGSLLYQEPRMVFSPEEQDAYDRLLNRISTASAVPTTITYQLPYPKYRFLSYASLSDRYIYHGSNLKDIELFEPRPQTLYSGRMVQAVFATADPIWPVFYAILDRNKARGSIRNACLEHQGKRYHFYSLSQSMLTGLDVWTDGMIYFLPRDRFRRVGHGAVMFDEWICEQPVVPLAKLPVTAEDFLYRHKVSTHREQESLIATYLKYKWRTRKGRLDGLTLSRPPQDRSMAAKDS